MEDYLGFSTLQAFYGYLDRIASRLWQASVRSCNAHHGYVLYDQNSAHPRYSSTLLIQDFPRLYRGMGRIR